MGHKDPPKSMRFLSSFTRDSRPAAHCLCLEPFCERRFRGREFCFLDFQFVNDVHVAQGQPGPVGPEATTRPLEICRRPGLDGQASVARPRDTWWILKYIRDTLHLLLSLYSASKDDMERRASTSGRLMSSSGLTTYPKGSPQLSVHDCQTTAVSHSSGG